MRHSRSLGGISEGRLWNSAKRCYYVAETIPSNDLFARSLVLYVSRQAAGSPMPTAQPNLWGASDAYERYMGRWSRSVAPIFTTWIGARSGAHWVDVGCGTGILTSAILRDCEPARIIGIDSSAVFLETAQQQVDDPRVSFKQGDAQAFSEGDGVFDVAVSGLVLNLYQTGTPCSER
ncbi:class I SAM-dependent methyltransferase [Microvirga sp. GCM10011540]|uniref:class I SAM-dependent methyltransferase n=1 Tax=Microvirga sp. GCM10011540 TaxID=3317338 RepID=UPI00361C5A0F